jgi:hypothetical protein
MHEPPVKRTVAFMDGQNLFHSVRESFGYTYPNFDVLALAKTICASQGWELAQVRFYTGIPDPSDDGFWNHFWVVKLRVMSWQGVRVFSRPLRYRNRRVRLPDGTEHTYLAGEEKGIDVRIALDVIRMAHHQEMDRQRRKQAEFLVPRFCPWAVIEEMAVVNSKAKAQAEGIIARFDVSLRRDVIVRSGWYY